MYNTEGRIKENHENLSHKISCKTNINMGGHSKTNLTEIFDQIESIKLDTQTVKVTGYNVNNAGSQHLISEQVKSP